MASENQAKKKEARAQALLEEAAKIREQIEVKRQQQEAREFERQKKGWARRPQDTHKKILVGVATIAILKDLPETEKIAFARKLLGKLDERDRAALLQCTEFQSIQ